MHPRPGWRGLLVLLIVVLSIFVIAYWQSFRVLPAGDDYNYINEIHRGSHDGVLRFFTVSVTGQSYRPLTSVGIWAFGKMFPDHPHVGIRLLNLLSAALFSVAILPWIGALRLGWIGSFVAIALILLHPVLPQAVGSIDGFNSLTSSAFLWLGAYGVFHWRDRLAPALLCAVVCFLIACGFKEYGFALVPLSMLVVICFWKKRPIVSALAFALVLGLLLVTLIWIRRFTVPASDVAQGGWEYLSLHPADLIRNVISNAALLATALLFFGNTIWVYVHRSPAVTAVVAAAVAAAMVWIAGGISILLKRTRVETIHSSGDSVNRSCIFLLLSLVAASFPVNVMTHVSEMYAPPIVLPLALLCGIAADGWLLASRGWRTLAGAMAGAALAMSFITIRAKIAGLVDVGERADRQARQILAFVPDDARDKTIAVRYLLRDQRARDEYAVFRIPDAHLLIHRAVLHWYRPYQGLALDAGEVPDLDYFDPSKYDVSVLWDAQRQQFVKIQR